MYSDISKLCITVDHTITEAIARINKNGVGIVLVVNKDRHLVGTVTDGDIRRAILDNLHLTASIAILLERKAGTRFAKPFTALIGQDRDVYLKLLKQHGILHLPLLDVNERVAGLVTMEDFVEEGNLSLQAVVMAGGRGSRLYPLTENLPKPMLPVGDKPLLEIIIGQMRSIGIRKVNVTTHHKPEKISEHFGNGENFDVELSYVSENRPLGTAGALGLLNCPTETLLVINGDILTQVDFRAMLQYHREHDAELTMAVRSYGMEVPYGVVECEGSYIRSLKEKPSMKFLVNAGIYLLEPSAHGCIPAGEHYNMTDLIQHLISEGRPVVSFPIHEYWLDIGARAEYEQAQEESRKRKF